MARTLPLASLAFFGAARAGSWAAADRNGNRAIREMPGSKSLVFINGPPFDEHLSQLAGGVERVAAEDEQVGRLPRLNGPMGLVEAEQGGRPGGQGLQGDLARQPAAHQVGNREERRVLGRDQI